MRPQKIISHRKVGTSKSRDLEVDHPNHNFIANGVVVSNSHSVCYAYVGYVCMWLKTNYALEWWASVLNNSNLEDLRQAALYVEPYVSKPHINESDLEFYIIDGNESKLVFPLNRVKNVGNAGPFLKIAAPYTSFIDFFERVDKTKANKRVVLSLIFAGAFDRICGVNSITDRNRIHQTYLELRRDKKALASYVPLTEQELLFKQQELLAIGEVDFVDLLKRRFKENIMEPSELELCDVKARITLGGYASRVTHTKIKKEGINKGKSMGFIDLQNKGKIASITVFPETYERFSESMQEGAVMAITGTVNSYKNPKTGESKTSLIADSIIVLEEVIQATEED